MTTASVMHWAAAGRARLARWRLPAATGLLCAFIYNSIVTPFPGWPNTMDFVPWWNAGRMLLDGRAGEIYNLDAQAEYQGRYTPQALAEYDGPLVYNRPPFFTYPFAVSALLPYEAAYRLWGALSIGAVCTSTWLIATRIYPARRPSNQDWAAWTITGFAFYPVLLGVIWGQSTLIELLLLVVFYVLYVRGRTFTAGAVLALLAFKPQFPPFFLLVLLLRREWRALAGFAVVAAAELALSVALVGVDGVVGYVHLLQDIYSWNCIHSAQPELHQSWRGMVVGLTVPPCWQVQLKLVPASVLPAAMERADQIALMLSVATIGVLAACWWRWRHTPSGSPQFDVAFAATCLAAQLASPQASAQEMSRLALVVALLLSARRALPDLLPRAFHIPSLVFLALVAGLTTIWPWFLYGSHPFVLFLGAAYAVLAVALLTAAPRHAASA